MYGRVLFRFSVTIQKKKIKGVGGEGYEKQTLDTIRECVGGWDGGRGVVHGRREQHMRMMVLRTRLNESKWT